MQLPNEIVLENNYPNPFNPTTFIEYSIPNQTFITLELFDVLGKKIKTLVNEYKTSGRYSYKLDMSNYANGIYFYSLKTKNRVISKKLVYLK
ncbi:MAG: T9SS type A sorting domain-containing protein [Ignavibacteriales bacterium]|nr:T9SS type A sorting domain-containing protein [Ignavibacteriales bacterium]